MGKERILAAAAVLALATGAWLATMGERDERNASVGAASATAGPAPAVNELLAALAPAAEERREEGEALRSSGREELDDRPATLALRLVARETRQPLPGVNVQLTRGGPRDVVYLSGQRGDEAQSPRSDAEGRVELEARAEQRYWLEIDPLGRAHVRAEKFQVPPLEPGQRLEAELDLETRDDLRWFGRVVDGETKRPLAGAHVEWRESWPLGAPAPIVSGADGVLALEFASWRESSVRVVYEGYREALVSLERGHETPELAQFVPLARPARLAVRVRDESGVPLPELAVEVRFELARSATGGSPTDFVLDESVLSVSVGSTARAIRPAGEQLRGRTDSAGTCTFDGLPPRVDGEVIVRRPGEPSQRQGLRLEPGEARELAFEFGSACSLRGRVQDEEGTPVAELDLWRLAGAEFPGYLESRHEDAAVDKVRTDEDGRFTFPSVPPGAWWIGAAPFERRGGASVPLTTRVLVAPGERVRELVLICPAARYIRGRVLTETGEPVQALVTATREGVLVRAEADSGGRFGLGPLPAGVWNLEAAPLADPPGTPPDRTWIAPSAPVRVLAGESDVELRLRAGGGLSGIVLDPGGFPAAGAEVEVLCEEDGAPRRTECNEHGAFRFVGLTPGRQRLLARSNERVCLLGPVHVEPGRWTAGLELRLAPGAELRLQLAADPGERRRYSLAWNGVPWIRGDLEGGTEIRQTLPPGTIRCELLAGPDSDAGRIGRAQETVLRAGEEVLLVFELTPAGTRR